MHLTHISFVIFLVAGTIGLFLIYGWKLVERHTFSEFFVGQVMRAEKAKIPGFKQYVFTYKKRGRPYVVNSRLVWRNTNLKVGGLYRIQVFHRKIPKRESVFWAVPMSNGKRV